MVLERAGRRRSKAHLRERFLPAFGCSQLPTHKQNNADKTDNSKNAVHNIGAATIETRRTDREYDEQKQAAANLAETKLATLSCRWRPNSRAPRLQDRPENA